MKDSAEKLIKQYHTKAPFVKQLMDNVSRKANDRGKIRTLLGRACHFDLWQPVQFGVFKPLPLEQARKEYDEPLKRAFTYKALNKLMAELGLMKESAEKLIKQYHSRAPFVKQLMDNVSRKANDRGKIRTLLGRACHFELWQPVQFGVYKPLPLEAARKEYGDHLRRAFTYKALNRLIQGSAADMTKKSMVALYENGIVPHIQIHDEVDISVESDKKAEEITKIMQSSTSPWCFLRS